MKKSIVHLICLASPLLVEAQIHYLDPDDPPEYRILHVAVPTNSIKPLLVTFEMAATGKTPVAVHKKNIGFSIWREKDFSLSPGDMVFLNIKTNILFVQPKSNIIVNVEILVDVFHRAWNFSGPGKYAVEISSGSGKMQQFDYEYMGQVHSPSFVFELK